MKYMLKIKYKIILLLIILIFLFPNKTSAFGEKSTYKIDGAKYYYTMDTDDGTDGPNTKDVEWKLKGYTQDTDTLAGIDVRDFEKNETYGWYEYEAYDKKWVVLRRSDA